MLSIQLFNKLGQFGYSTAVFCDCSIPVYIDHSFLTSAPDVRYAPVTLPPRGKNPLFPLEVRWPHSGSERFGEKKICCRCPHSNPGSSSQKLWIPSRNTQYLYNAIQYCCVLRVDHSETSVYQTTRRHILYQGALYTVSNIAQYYWPSRGNIDGLHNILNSLWTVLRYIHAVAVCLSSSKHVSITIIPAARERTPMNFFFFFSFFFQALNFL
jgi:hypothetical protein